MVPPKFLAIFQIYFFGLLLTNLIEHLFNYLGWLDIVDQTAQETLNFVGNINLVLSNSLNSASEFNQKKNSAPELNEQFQPKDIGRTFKICSITFSFFSALIKSPVAHKIQPTEFCPVKITQLFIFYGNFPRKNNIHQSNAD